MLFLASSAKPWHYILENTQWADDGAIDASEYQSQHNQENNHSNVQRKYGGEELYLCQPSQPGVQCAGEIKEQPCDEYKHNKGTSQSYFS